MILQIIRGDNDVDDIWYVGDLKLMTIIGVGGKIPILVPDVTKMANIL